MLTIAQSTITTLLYETRQGYDLKTLAEAIEADLIPERVGPVSVSWDGETFVAFDLETVRISLARVDLSGTGRAGLADCLIIAVGSAPGRPSSGPVFEGRDALCAALAEEIDALVPASRIFTTRAETVVSAKFLERVAETFTARNPAPKGAALPAVAPRRPTRRSADPVERPGRSRRVGPVRTAGRTIALPSPALLSKVEQGQLAEATILRKSIHDPTEDELLERQMSRRVTRRIAVFSIHTGVILLSAPIGAATLTYAALGRESARAAAHTLALTGVLMGLAGAGMAGPVLDALI